VPQGFDSQRSHFPFRPSLPSPPSYAAPRPTGVTGLLGVLAGVTKAALGCPLGFPPLWLFCTSPWPEHVVTYAYDNAMGWVAMIKFLAIAACSLALALSVAGCAGKGKVPVSPPVVTKG
jgi:hypothetical protein